jgi:hypothetical protein
MLQAIGCDPLIAGSLDLADFIQPVYVLDDLGQSLPRRGSLLVEMSLIPGTAAAAFSGFEIAGVFGMYVNRLTQNAVGNWVWSIITMIPGLGAIGNTVDATMNAILVPPEGSSLTAGGTNLHANAPSPWLARANSGTDVGLPAVTVFEVLSGEAFPGEGVWVPPGSSLVAFSGVVNTAVRFRAQLEFPAQGIQQS